MKKLAVLFLCIMVIVVLVSGCSKSESLRKEAVEVGEDYINGKIALQEASDKFNDLRERLKTLKATSDDDSGELVLLETRVSIISISMEYLVNKPSSTTEEEILSLKEDIEKLK